MIIVQLDLVNSTKIIDNLFFQGDDAKEIRQFLTDRIEELVENANTKSITNSNEIEYKKALADGYQLGFKNTESAYCFVKTFCEDVNTRNKNNSENQEWLFRIGAAKGDVDFRPSSPNQYVGKAFITLKELSEELEKKADPGWFFVNASTYEDFPNDIKENFSQKWYLNKHSQGKKAWVSQMMFSTSNLQIKPFEDDLRSDRFVDYTQLRDLLKAGKWLQANEETLAVMLKATGSQKEGELSSIYIEKFPCTDLHTIDQLWEKYSDKYFGFSVQKRIWERVGKNYNKFGNRVGWRTGSSFNQFNTKWITRQELTSNTTLKEGQLPFWDVFGMMMPSLKFLPNLSNVYRFYYEAYQRIRINFLMPFPIDVTECSILDRLAKCNPIIEAKGKHPQTREKVSSQLSDDNELKSVRNLCYRYAKIRDLLIEQKWNEADKETYSVMLLAVDSNEDEWIRKDEILEFPCIDLNTIDQLWFKYSSKRFGFSVQMRIYLEVGGVLDGKFSKEAWKTFSSSVGWRVDQTRYAYKEITSDTIVPDGYFPQWYVFNELNPLEGWKSLIWSAVAATSQPFLLTFYSTHAWFNLKNIFSRIQACKLNI